MLPHAVQDLSSVCKLTAKIKINKTTILPTGFYDFEA
jgi:hypothetical protein